MSVRYTVAANDTQSRLNNISVSSIRPFSGDLLLPSYFSQAQGEASAWQVLKPERGLSAGNRRAVGVSQRRPAR
jgi:hypothetical protein